jgi:starch-binding outer membrane protein, SusD/RagB family
MKIKINSINFLVALFVGGFTISCNPDFVSTRNLGAVSSAAAWKDGPLSEAFVTEIYNGLQQGGFPEQMLASLTDEALFTHPGRGINTVNGGLATPSNPGWVNNTYNYGDMYNRIRAANVALKNLSPAQFPDAALAARLRGEAYFLRAYYYHQMARHYGGIPLVDRPYELGEPDYTIARNTWEETVNFIIKDCDSAVTLLTGKSMAKGRATKDAALALKSRILLYAASDLHDIPTAKTKSALFAANKDSVNMLLGYMSGSRLERWQKAKAAAKAVLDISGYAYKLNLNAPVTPQEGTMNYKSLAMAGGSAVLDKSAASEIIFGRFFIVAKNEDGQRQGQFNGPNGYHNWAGNSPIQNLVDDYEMMDGSKFDWNNPVHATAPYANRDPRFYGTILYDGATWKPRTPDVAPKDPANQIQTGEYQLGSSAAPTTYFGLDTRKSSVEDWNGTHSGYYVHKFIDPNPAIVDQNTRQYIPWVFFRYTEIVFNYAEACLELGEETETRLWLNRIRYRAGMPAISETGPALKQRLIQEKRIEMAYEEQRYYDTRRWMIAPTTLGKQAVLIKINGKLKAGKTVTVYKYSLDDYDYTYARQEYPTNIENRTWNDKMYFVPIHRDEINRNKKLLQNPGY